jgi:hypothetical protein
MSAVQLELEVSYAEAEARGGCRADVMGQPPAASRQRRAGGPFMQRESWLPHPRVFTSFPSTPILHTVDMYHSMEK